METLLQDSFFYWVIWSVASLIGVVLGWSLRYLLVEKKVTLALERSEQERNALARLYTQLKHQYDLREVDLKKNAIEAAQLRNQVKEFDMLRALHASERQADAERMEKMEARAQHLVEKTALLEARHQGLRAQNAQLVQALTRKQEEINAWKNLHRDFAAMQRQLRTYEKAANTLDYERRQLQDQLAAARLEIENLQLDLLNAGKLSPKTDPVASQPPAHQPHQPTTDRRQPTADRRPPTADNDVRPNAPDDLKIINGISPFAERRLNAIGIYSFDQISRWDDAAVVSVAKSLDISPARILQDDWVGQARHLLEQSL
ncbi:MAG: hypothetical protein SFV52_06520 [Saprospiraceae bacterium]|nr:hypothetical protein [Saprospiraceae bacterium]